MIGSVTEIQTEVRCKRMWGLTSFNGEGLTPIRHAPALMLGTLFHQTQADWLIHQDDDPVQICEVHYAAMYEEQRERYYKTHGFSPMERELGPVAESGELCKAMIRNYRDYYGSPLPKGFRCIMPEQTIVIDVPGAVSICKHCRGQGNLYDPTRIPVSLGIRNCMDCNGTGTIQHQLEGTLDAIIADPRDKVFVLDHKTYGARPKLTSIENNFQFRTYVWATRQLGIGNVVGFLYDGAWKRATPPRGKTMDDLFLRTPVTYNEYQLDEIGKFIALKLCEMYEISWEQTMLDHSRRWEGCYDCSVEELCTAMSRGEDVAYLKAEHFTLRERTSAFADADVGTGFTDG